LKRREGLLAARFGLRRGLLGGGAGLTPQHDEAIVESGIQLKPLELDLASIAAGRLVARRESDLRDFPLTRT